MRLSSPADLKMTPSAQVPIMMSPASFVRLLIPVFGMRIMPGKDQSNYKTRRSVMRTRLIVVSFGLLAVFALLTVTAIAADTLVGTWKLNVAKSKYSPGPAPQSNTIKFEAVDGGIKLTADGVDAQGKKTHNNYTAK